MALAEDIDLIFGPRLRRAVLRTDVAGAKAETASVRSDTRGADPAAERSDKRIF